MREVERESLDIRHVHGHFIVDESLWSDRTWTLHIQTGAAINETRQDPKPTILEADDITYYDRPTDEEILEKLNEWLADHEE